MMMLIRARRRSTEMVKQEDAGPISLTCPHDRALFFCRICNGKGVCPHGRQRSICVACRGGSICKHNIRRTRCGACGGGSICEHKKLRQRCPECQKQKAAKPTGCWAQVTTLTSVPRPPQRRKGAPSDSTAIVPVHAGDVAPLLPKLECAQPREVGSTKLEMAEPTTCPQPAPTLVAPHWQSVGAFHALPYALTGALPLANAKLEMSRVPNAYQSAPASAPLLVAPTPPTMACSQFAPFLPLPYYYPPLMLAPRIPQAYAHATPSQCGLQATIEAAQSEAAAKQLAAAQKEPPSRPTPTPTPTPTPVRQRDCAPEVQVVRAPENRQGACAPAPADQGVCPDAERPLTESARVELWERGFRDVMDTWVAVGTLCQISM